MKIDPGDRFQAGFLPAAKPTWTGRSKQERQTWGESMGQLMNEEEKYLVMTGAEVKEKQMKSVHVGRMDGRGRRGRHFRWGEEVK